MCRKFCKYRSVFILIHEHSVFASEKDRDREAKKICVKNFKSLYEIVL